MRRRTVVLGLVAAAMVVGGAAACSPIYVLKAGIAEMKILRARRPIPEVLVDPATDPDTRAKLGFVMEARTFAMEELGIDAGDSYTMYTKLDRDTLAMVLSAARRDALVSKTWWFPIVGHVPYKGFFDLDDALDAQAELEEEGLDTYLRPTAAFSTLGWFNDPILSTVLRGDEVEVVETVLHELSHQFLFVPGQVGFNESFATFVGRVGAARFFCTRPGGGPDTVKCERARTRWRDYQRFSVFIDGLVDDLRRVYARPDLTAADKERTREDVFHAALERFDADVAPTFESVGFAGFRATPLNNATLLARMRYFHRLPDFQALLERTGDLPATLAWLKERVNGVEDPFTLLDPADGTGEVGWEVQVADSSASWVALHPVDDHTVWAVGAAGQVARTVDGGLTWQRLRVPGAETLSLRDVHAFGPLEAFVLSIGSGTDSRIFRTRDGGGTWETVFQNEDPNAFFDCFAFWDRERGFAFSDSHEGAFPLIRTTDGGRSWQRIDPARVPAARPGEGAFASSGTCVAARPGGLGWFATGASGVDTRVVRTADYGDTWTDVVTPIPSQSTSAGIFSLTMADDTLGVIVGGTLAPGDSEGVNVALTRDGGQTWTWSGDHGMRVAYGVDWIPGAPTSSLVAVSPEGAMLSRDGGASWSRLSDMNSWVVRFASPRVGWAAGRGHISAIRMR